MSEADATITSQPVGAGASPPVSIDLRARQSLFVPVTFAPTGAKGGKRLDKANSHLSQPVLTNTQCTGGVCSVNWKPVRRIA